MDTNAILHSVVTTGIRVVIALLIILLSFWLIGRIERRVTKRLAEHGKLTSSFIRGGIQVASILMKICVALAVAGYLGFDTGGLTALLTSLGVCIGLAVNGALANLAGSVVLLFTKPFCVGDYIEACGQAGTVEDIRLTDTKLVTYDNKVIYLPNGTLSSSQIVNHYVKPQRRVDLDFEIAYESDIGRAKEAILAAANAHPLTLHDPAPAVVVKEYGSSGIQLTARVWTDSPNYFALKFALLEDVKAQFDRQGITIPFSQLDVHIVDSGKAD